MWNQKPSIRELVWLSRLKQPALFGSDLPEDSRLSSNEDCNEDDCIPWHHKRSECVLLRRQKAEQTTNSDQTSVL